VAQAEKHIRVTLTKDDLIKAASSVPGVLNARTARERDAGGVPAHRAGESREHERRDRRRDVHLRQERTRRMTLEINIETPFVRECVRRGFRAEKWGLDGWPDRQILLGNGQHFWMEFKRLTGRFRKAQEIMREKLEEMGERVYVPRSYSEAVTILDNEVRLHRGGSPLARNRGW
jgi:hypothetical protein